MRALAEANISPGLRQVAIYCAAAWPYRQAQQSIQQLIGVSISHQQIRQLYLQEAVKVQAREQTNFQQAYSPGRNGRGISRRAVAVKETAAD